MSNIVTSTHLGGPAIGVNANGVYVIGGTNDITYGGDMSSDVAGTGVLTTIADGDKCFALSVYADDGGTVVSSNGWVSSVFGSMVLYAAHTASNFSAFGVAGQIHIGANVTTIGNIAGVYGIVEGDGSETITGNAFGGLFGFTLGASQTLASGYYMGGIMVGGSNNGTTTGTVVAMFIQNPSGNQFDAAFAFGQDSQFAGCVTAAAVGGLNTHKLKVYAGGTLYYIPMYTA